MSKKVDWYYIRLSCWVTAGLLNHIGVSAASCASANQYPLLVMIRGDLRYQGFGPKAANFLLAEIRDSPWTPGQLSDGARIGDFHHLFLDGIVFKVYLQKKKENTEFSEKLICKAGSFFWKRGAITLPVVKTLPKT